jgi:hypothetical protein
MHRSPHRRTSLSIAFLLSLCSCATVRYDDTHAVRFTTRPANATVRVAGDTTVYVTPADVPLPRGPEPVEVVVSLDTIEQTLFITPVLSQSFLFGNLVAPIIAHAIDLPSDRKWAFDDEIFVAFDDSTLTYPRWRERMPFAGDLRFGWQISAIMSIYGNVVDIDTGGGRWQTGGMLLNAAVLFDYFHSRSAFVTIGGRALTDVMGECFGNCPPSFAQLSVSLGHGHEVPGWRFAYGVRASKQIIRYRDRIEPPYMRTFMTVGTTLAAAFRLADHVHLGVEYSPGINVGPDRTGGGFSHDLAIGFLFNTARSSPFE